MVEYNIIKYCRICKKRFIVNRGESKIVFCPNCQIKVDTERNKEEVKE